MPYPPFTAGCGAQPAAPLGFAVVPTPTTGIDGDAFPTPSGLFLNAAMSEPSGVFGDYVVSGIGTRNTGTGRIKIVIPEKTQVLKAFLIINTYVPNSLRDPGPATALPFSIQKIVSPPTAPPASMLLPAQDCSYYCGSTCWLNPGPEMTTYLKNRIYIYDVGGIVDGSGMWEVSGLPLTAPLMAIGTDGDRLPGCASSQGALIYVIYSYPTVDRPKGLLVRQIQTYVGARLIAASPGTWGGSISQLTKFFSDFFLPNIPPVFAGNAKLTFAAGDTQASITGDSASVNSIKLAPPSNSFRKIGPSLSVISQKMSNIYAFGNKALVETSDDCVAWFFFAFSSDESSPKADFTPVSCLSTRLANAMTAVQIEMEVTSNIGILPNIPACIGQKMEAFPGCPFYVRVDKEIILVMNRDPNDYEKWDVIVRGQGGTTPALHNKTACVKLVLPYEAKAKMQAALAKKGRPQSLPGPGKLQQRNIIQGLR